MFYFNSLPIINYSGDTMRDIFKRIVIKSELDNDWFDVYRMNEEETLHDVSYKLYNTINYWWLLCLINNIRDYHYDAVIPTEILQKLAQDLQVLELTSLKDYILIPRYAEIEMINNYDVRGTILDKYFLNEKYYVDVRLDSIENKFPQTSNVKLSTERIAKLSLSSSSIYNIGDIVRQDFATSTDSIEGFCRGHIVWKDYNDIYIYKTKLTDFKVTGTVDTIANKETTASKLILIGRTVLGVNADILETTNVTDFEINNSAEYKLNFLDRYDRLETINNANSIIKVIKKEHVTRLQNLILSQLG